MKWGGVFFVKKWKMGGVVVKKSGKWECLCKKVDLSSMQGALCTVSVFFILHFVLIWGVCARTQRTPLPTGLVKAVVYWGVYTGIRRIPTSGVFLTAYTHLSDHK